MGSKPQQWSNGLCSCCAEFGNCVAVFCCFPCKGAQNMRSIGQNYLWGFCKHSLLYPCCAAASRQQFRHAYNIEGTLCDDCCASFCPCCSVIQQANQIIQHGSPPSISMTLA
jgi:Cys-rich protein (TIGR01571 family)